MIRKVLVTILSLVVVAGTLWGDEALSVLGTAADRIRDNARPEMSLDFEIERAKGMIETILPEMERCMELIAAQEFDLSQLEKAATQKQLALAEQKENLLAIRTDLDRNEKQDVYAGVTYSSDELREDLEEQFDAYRRAETALEADRRLINARKKTLRGNRKELENMAGMKMDLEIRIAELEAEVQELKAAEIDAGTQFDGSKVAETRKFLNDLEKRIHIRKRVQEQQGRFSGRIKATESGPPARDVASEIDQHFDNDSSESAVEPSRYQL